MTLEEALNAYQERFKQGAPIFGMDDEKEILEKIKVALEKNKPITDTPDKHIPKGALL